jgi:CDP-4-dehydro-6-deoxyglucose reductase
MRHLLSMSRAARLASISRGELQKQIRTEDVKTFEGMVAVEDLITLFPEINMESDPVFERVQKLKKNARPKSRYTDDLLPDAEVLMSRLKDYQHTLVQTKSALNASEQLLEEILDDLEGAADEAEAQLRQQVQVCIKRLGKAMGRLGRAEDAKAALFARDALLKVVSPSVRLLPSAHEFFVDGSDSILDAGLKTGLYLDYGCASGNCGACKCRVVSGMVKKLREHDYVLSAREQEEGYILACSNTALSDLVLEANEAGWEVELPRQEIRATVREIEPTGSDLAVLHLKTPRTKSLRFKAGQRVRLTAEDGTSAEHYIASCPCDGRNLQFLLQREQSGDLGSQAFDGSLARQTIMIEGPYGDFGLQEEAMATLLFVAAGNGLAPIKSLVEQAITIDTAERLQLLHLGGNEPDTPLDNLCRSWGDSLENFDYRVIEQSAPVVEVARQLQLDAPQGMDVYLAGPSSWLEEVRSMATEQGLDTDHWHFLVVD